MDVILTSVFHIASMLFHKKTLLLLYLTTQFILSRHICHIFCRKNLFTVVKDRISRNSIVSICTEQHANCGIIIMPLYKIIVHTNIHIKLSDILMCQLMCFQFKDYKTFHLEVIKHKVYVKITRVCHNMLLPFHESEPTAKFHYKLFKIVNK